MPHRIEIATIEAAIQQAERRQKQYDDAYTAYVVGTNIAVESFIKLAMAVGTEEERLALAEDYRMAMGGLLKTRQYADNMQFERINMQGTLIQIVKLINMEVIDVLKRHEQLLAALKAFVHYPEPEPEQNTETTVPLNFHRTNYE
jgi:hypothetical protein